MRILCVQESINSRVSAAIHAAARTLEVCDGHVITGVGVHSAALPRR